MKTIAARCALTLGIVMALSAPLAQAALDTSCDDTVATKTNPGYLGCIGPLDYTFAAGAASATEISDLSLSFPLSGGAVWKRIGLSTDAGFGPFSVDPTGLSAGSLLLDSLRSDLFVIGLQAFGQDFSTGGRIPRVSYFEFDYSKLAATNSIAFDTLGIDSANNPGPALQVAALYTVNGTTPGGPGGGNRVPEPGTWALAGAALAVLAVGRLRHANRRRDDC